MPFDKFLNKAKNLANDPKVREKLNSDKAEKATDSLLDKAAGVAESLTKGKHTDKIQKARDTADRAVGTDEKAGPEQTGNGRSQDRPAEPNRSPDEQGGSDEQGGATEHRGSAEPRRNDEGPRP